MLTFTASDTFTTESGETLPELTLAYCTYGTYEPGRSKVVWICHALTASADVAEWWPGLVGDGKAINQHDYFIVCVNIPGSCYGSTGPLSENPETGRPYYDSFPFFTIRDMVQSFILLRKHLGISEIYLLAGGSMGGYQCIEWAIMEPERIQNLMLVATSARESAWGIAIHTAQRTAIETDPTFGLPQHDAGAAGMKTARMIGMLTYRSYEAFVSTQSDDDERIHNFSASSYMHYQGQKLVNRFNAYTYHALTRSMDSHNAGRDRGGLSTALKMIRARTLCIGITTDMLCPIPEQKEIASHINNAVFQSINSPFGHDGFLVEGEKIGVVLDQWLQASER
jgi:homoserine O-acetyltransferase/O-succinyltransferase